MIEPEVFYRLCEQAGFSSFYGVPDSTLKHFCSYITDVLPKEQHTICVNEGLAVSMGVGYHLATGEVPVVYMQNSGLGNAVNPLTSLVAKEVYSVPMLLVVGWRGEPGVKDEPQHVFQGRVTTIMLDTLEIPYSVVDKDSSGEEALHAMEYMQKHSSPYALLVRKGTFSSYLPNAVQDDSYALTRENVIKIVMDNLDSSAIYISTTGMTSRELFELRNRKGESHGSDFLTVGGMGCASSIALGVAMAKPDRMTVCLDGDGAALMHMGALAAIGEASPNNFLHVVINNGVYGSTGNQPTMARTVDLCRAAKACGYTAAVRTDSEEELRELLCRDYHGATLIEVMSNITYRKELGRPTSSPLENKHEFMGKLKQ